MARPPCSICAQHPAFDAVVAVIARHLGDYEDGVGPNYRPIYEGEVTQHQPDFLVVEWRFDGLEVVGGPEDGRVLGLHEVNKLGMAPAVNLHDWTTLFTDHTAQAGPLGTLVDGIAFDRPLTILIRWLVQEGCPVEVEE